MANVVRDPKTHPDAILPDLSKPDPLVKFTKDDIAFVYGSKWKQRYFTKKGDDFYPLGAQWDITHQVWRSYQVAPGTDWWTAYYPGGNMQRPTGPLCDGCHSVNYNIETKTVTEWNVGCEKCHGPGAVAHRKAIAREYRESGASRFCASERRLHPVSFAGPAARQSNQRQVLRLAGWLRSWQELTGLLEAGRTQVRAAIIYSFCRRNRAQESHARERLRSPAKCTLTA